MLSIINSCIPIYFIRIAHVLEVRHMLKYFAEQTTFSYRSLTYFLILSFLTISKSVVCKLPDLFLEVG